MFVARLSAARDEAAASSCEMRAGHDLQLSSAAAKMDDEDLSITNMLLDYLEHIDAEGWAELREFEERALPRFTAASRASAEEHRLEETQLWKEWCRLVERKLDAFLRRENLSVQRAVAAVEAAHRRAGGVSGSSADDFLRAITSVDDFKSWATEMRLQADLLLSSSSSTVACGAVRGFCNLPRESGEWD